MALDKALITYIFNNQFSRMSHNGLMKLELKNIKSILPLVVKVRGFSVSDSQKELELMLQIKSSEWTGKFWVITTQVIRSILNIGKIMVSSFIFPEVACARGDM